MVVKKFINKRLRLNQLKEDISCRELIGAHYHEKGSMDVNFQVLEFVIFPGPSYTYAFKIYILDDVIKKIERVKFQWECSGWRCEDIVLKRFPVGLNVNEPVASEALEEYLADY